jgi:hypothetical protein
LQTTIASLGEITRPFTRKQAIDEAKGRSARTAQ